MSSNKPKPFEIPISYKVSDSVSAAFATNLVVQHEPGYFILSFYQVFPPLLTGDSEAKRHEELGSLSAIEAKCVSQVVVPADKMHDFIKVQEDNFDKFKKHMAMLIDQMERKP